MITFPKNKKLLIFSFFILILTVLWTFFIFSFSLQTAEVSSKVSTGLLTRILMYIHGILWFEIDFATLHNFFRSFAHFSEFFVLGILATGYIKTLKTHILFSGLYCLIVAITDETIQHITASGRAAQLIDVITDFSGSLLAIILLNITLYFIKKIKNKKRKNGHTTN